MIATADDKVTTPEHEARAVTSISELRTRLGSLVSEIHHVLDQIEEQAHTLAEGEGTTGAAEQDR